MSPCPFPTTITIATRAPPNLNYYNSLYHYHSCYVEECDDTASWVKHRSPTNKHNCWNGMCYWSHITRSHHHHHHVVPPARISLTLSRHFSLSFIASGRSSGLHPVSSHSCWMYVRAGCPAFAWPYVGVHRSTSLMSSPLLLQQCPACLVHLTCIVFVMGGKWPYSWCLVGCCRQDLFNIALNILV